MAVSSPPEQLRQPHDNDSWWLLRKIWERVNRKNKHFMLCIVGAEGDGKSHTALRICDEVDPTFSADRVIYDVVDLLETLHEGRHEPGYWYVLDEAGVQFGRRTWAEREQVIANQVLQIVRDENLGLVFTVPALGDLDTQTQRRLTAFYEITEWNKDEHVRGKFKFMDPDRTDETGKIYKKYPRRVAGTGGMTRRITSVAFEPPPAGLVKPYEREKTKFQQATYKQAIEELTGGEDDEGSRQLTPQEVVADIRENGGIEKYVKVANNGQEYIDANLIEFDYEIPATKAKTVKKALKREWEGGGG